METCFEIISETFLVREYTFQRLQCRRNNFRTLSVAGIILFQFEVFACEI